MMPHHYDDRRTGGPRLVMVLALAPRVVWDQPGTTYVSRTFADGANGVTIGSRSNQRTSTSDPMERT